MNLHFTKIGLWHYEIKETINQQTISKIPNEKCYTTFSVYLFAWHSFCCDMEGDILIMKKNKQLIKRQRMKLFNENTTTVLNLVARLLVCAFMLAVVIYSLPL